MFTDKPGITKAITHSIKLSCTTPLWTPSYTVPLAHREAFKQDIDMLLELGIIKVSHSLWSSPPIPIKKKDGGIRIVCDFRRLNTVTIPEPFLMPTIESIIAKLGSSTILSKLDLLKGFYQVPMEQESKQYTAFCCAHGKFQFRVMPFGLWNAPATFQLLMQRVLAGCEQYALPYIDNVIIYSTSFEDHLIHVANTLERLAHHSLTVKKSKCHWVYMSFEFWGHMVGSGIAIPQARIEFMSQYKIPKTKSQLKAFLGLINLYSKFIPAFAHHTHFLSPHTKASYPNMVNWSTEMTESFNYIITTICNHTMLIVPCSSDALCVFVDASTTGVGGVLCMSRDDTWMPTAFYSRQLQSRESKYSATELEALALLTTIEHFSYYLSGREFVAYTDHIALTHILDKDGRNSSSYISSSPKLYQVMESHLHKEGGRCGDPAHYYGHAHHTMQEED